MKVICTKHEKCHASKECGHGKPHELILECLNDCAEHKNALCLKVVK